MMLVQMLHDLGRPYHSQGVKTTNKTKEKSKIKRHGYSLKASRIFLAISRYCHIPPATFLNWIP